ncbi:MAG: aggregation factor core [Pseudomonadota bacterium]
MHLLGYTAAAILMGASAAQAELNIRFVESAPKDRFEISWTGSCALAAGEIEIDLAPAPADLVFDTEEGGRGVEVYQPFEVAAGGELITNAPRVKDGAKQITLSHAKMQPGAAFVFTIDVDDAAGNRLGPIRVSGSEMAGTVVRTKTGSNAAFSDDNLAALSLGACS